MTVSQKLQEIDKHYNYWIGNYQRKELNTNNVRITAESVAKAAILENKGLREGKEIILGRNSALPSDRTSSPNHKLSFSELIQVLRDLNLFRSSNTIDLQFELVRNATNKGSHSSNTRRDETTLDDLEICHTSIKIIIKWLYENILRSDIPQNIQENLKDNLNQAMLDLDSEKFNDFEIACENFDKRRYQYIFVSPESLAEDSYSVNAFVKLPWRLILDFNPKSDEEESGLLNAFNSIKGSGYKKVFTIDDKIEFDPNFPHYWFMANGQGPSTSTSEYKPWKTKYKRFLSEQLYQSFVKGSRLKSRIVVLLNIEPFYAEDIISEFNRVDEENLKFVLISETETYENIFAKIDNVELVNISPQVIANGIYNSLNYEDIEISEHNYLIPYFKDDKKSFLSVSQDHYDYLFSLGIELVYKGIERSTQSDDSYAFFKGGVISWRDLSEQKDVTRNALENLQKKLRDKLNENRLEEIQLIHEAGAGGTTLARRVAYNFSVNCPVVILKKYYHKKTIDGLRIIYDQYTKGSLPLLIITESYEVKDTHLLYRDLSKAKKNAVILIIHRGFLNKPRNKKISLNAQLDGSELNAFEATYSMVAPEQKVQLRNIPKDYTNSQRYITPVLYALTAFGKDYQGLEQYIQKSLQGATLEQRELVGFICIIYYYTQKSVQAELFSALFKVTRSKCDLNEILGKESPLLELLHQESDENEYYNIWRPRYALVGEEAMKIILGGGVEYKNDWKNQLTHWLLELIRYVRLNLEYLDDDTLEIFNSLFIERSFVEDNSQDKEFTKTIHDLNPNNGVAIFEALTIAYPKEAHFHGHFARYLYSKQIGIKDYDRAISEANKSLDIHANNATLIHTLGMCYREKAENIINNYEKLDIAPDVAEEEVISLTEEACRIFDECIDEDPNDIYGYESQIRVILKTLDFGSRIHNATSKESFITDSKNSWYAEYFDKVSRLLEEALFVIEQSIRLENRERIQKSAEYIYQCEALLFRTIGKYVKAKSKFENLVHNTPRGYDHMRPYYRRMFIICLLASKSRDQRNLFKAWGGISEAELNQCVQFLEANILEDPNNSQNLRLWLQAIRYLNNPPSLSSCIARVASWTQITNQNSNSSLEGYYYLYVLNSILAISEGNLFDASAIQMVKDLKEKMKPYIKNEKFCYEWYGKGDGVKKMINHRQLGDYSNDFFERNKHILIEVSGRIKEINSSQQGTIILDCGLEAFFVPGVGSFTERNQNDKIKCYVGFRYDQIQAWSVVLQHTDRNLIPKINLLEINELIEEPFEEIQDSILSEDVKNADHVDLPRLSKPVVVGKIELPNQKNNLPKPFVRKIKPEKGKVYEGIIKLKMGNIGFIDVPDLMKNIAFKPSHLVESNFFKIKVGQTVFVSIQFKEDVQLDSKGRNYIAEIVKVKK